MVRYAPPCVSAVIRRIRAHRKRCTTFWECSEKKFRTLGSTCISDTCYARNHKTVAQLILALTMWKCHAHTLKCCQGSPCVSATLTLERPGSNLDQPWIDPGSTLSRPWIDPGSILYQSWIGPGSILDRPWIDPGSILDRPWIATVDCSTHPTTQAALANRRSTSTLTMACPVSVQQVWHKDILPFWDKKHRMTHQLWICWILLTPKRS